MAQQVLAGDGETEDAATDDDDVGRGLEGCRGEAQGRRV
jgi:hypothetical protein